MSGRVGQRASEICLILGIGYPMATLHPLPSVVCVFAGAGRVMVFLGPVRKNPGPFIVR